jgi:hypothetical protein
MKINLDQQFMDLRGNPLQEKMCDVLADAIAMASTGNPKKVMKWAHDLLDNGEIEITAADVQFLRMLILNSHLNNLQRFQLLERMSVDEQKTEGKPWRLRITLK